MLTAWIARLGRLPGKWYRSNLSTFRFIILTIRVILPTTKYDLKAKLSVVVDVDHQLYLFQRIHILTILTYFWKGAHISHSKIVPSRLQFIWHVFTFFSSPIFKDFPCASDDRHKSVFKFFGYLGHLFSITFFRLSFPYLG